MKGQTIKRVFLFACLVWLVSSLTLPACAMDLSSAVSKQEEAAGIPELEREAERLGSKVKYGESLETGVSKLLQESVGIAKMAGKAALKSGITILIVVLFCGVVELVYQMSGSGKRSFIHLAGTLSIAMVAIADINVMLGMGRNFIKSMTAFSNILFPVTATISAATGAVTGAAVRQMASVLFSNLLINLIQKILIPMFYGYIAASVAHAALGNEGLKKVGGVLKWMTTTLLTIVMLTFVGYLTVSGVVAGSADAITVKAAKFTISSSIPVVGGILSDAAETILVSAGVLRGTVGVFGMLTVFGMCLTPLLRMAASYLMYKLVGAISSTVSAGSPLGSFVEQIGTAFGLMMGMTGACCLLLLVSLVSSITAVSV